MTDKSLMPDDTKLALAQWTTASEQGDAIRASLNDIAARMLTGKNCLEVLSIAGYSEAHIKAYAKARGLTFKDPTAVAKASTKPRAEKKPKTPAASSNGAATDTPATDGAATDTATSARPTSYTVGGTTAATKSWRDIYVRLAEQVYAEGKIGDVKGAPIKDTPHPTRPASQHKLPDGKYLDVNFNQGELRKRIRLMAAALGSTLSVTLSDGTTTDA